MPVQVNRKMIATGDLVRGRSIFHVRWQAQKLWKWRTVMGLIRGRVCHPKDRIGCTTQTVHGDMLHDRDTIEGKGKVLCLANGKHSTTKLKDTVQTKTNWNKSATIFNQLPKANASNRALLFLSHRSHRLRLCGAAKVPLLPAYDSCLSQYR